MIRLVQLFALLVFATVSAVGIYVFATDTLVGQPPEEDYAEAEAPPDWDLILSSDGVNVFIEKRHLLSFQLIDDIRVATQLASRTR